MLSQDKQPTCYMPQGNGSPSPAFGRVVGQKPFFKQGSYTTVAATWGTVAEFTVPTGFEGELVHASGADVAGSLQSRLATTDQWSFARRHPRMDWCLECSG
jgi:hypothetical protein